MSLILSLLCLVFAAGICVLIVGLMTAPVGAEDDLGFHAVRPIKQARVAPVEMPSGLHHAAHS